MSNKRSKINEDMSAPEGFATLSDTPGMGDVVLPTENTRGSGDVFGGLMNFSSWKKTKRRRRRKRKH